MLDPIRAPVPEHCDLVTRTGWAPKWDDIYDVLRARTDGYSFVPRPEALADPLHSTPSDWAPIFRDVGPTRELYNPSYGPILELDQQAAFFLRDDSISVAAAIELLGHPIGSGPVEAGLILSRNETEPLRIVRERGSAPGRFVFRMMVPAERHLVGLEVLTENRGAARARFGHGLPEFTPGGVGLSDLLLFLWSPDLPEDLEAIAPRMLGNTRIVRGQNVGVFFEIYGAVSEDLMEVSLTVEPVQGTFGRLLSALRFSRPQRIRTGWEEGAAFGGAPFIGRGLQLDLSSLSAGRYLLELRLRTPEGEEVVSRREIEVVR